MHIPLLPNHPSRNLKALCLLTAAVVLSVFLTMMQDLLEATFNKSGFYISESFMFSSVWWLFVPFLYAQYRFVLSKASSNVFVLLPLIALPVLLHLFAFPALVWLLSRLFYYHTFQYQQAFQYGLSEYLLQLILLYSIPILAFQYYRSKVQARQRDVSESSNARAGYETSLVVSEGSKRTRINITEIHYITASPPYVNIHHKNKTYLHNETLKSISEKIKSNEFVRIHKSTIVNIGHLQSYKSRLNGDYDVTMKDGSQLRISRIYAASFKDSFHRQSS